MRYKIGEKVFGNWEIVAELGEGSFGKVFRLEKNTYHIKASSALKVLTVPHSQVEIEDAVAEGYDEQSLAEQFHEIVEKLVDEIAIMAELKSHPNIVSVEDYMVIEHEDTIGWDILIRMELLTSLQEYQRKNCMDETAVRKLASDICQALAFCQTKHLIHRDIKPGNVFVDSMGHFKLGDFGVARTAEKTISNMSKQGTENYMAPEVYYGRKYGANVDIYSLGMMLYRLMNKNRLPFYPLPPAFPKFSEKEDALLRRLKGETLPVPCDASEEFATIILKACEADPDKRYRTAEEMLSDLNDLGFLSVKSAREEAGRKKTEEDTEELLENAHHSLEFLDSISFEQDEVDLEEDDSWEETVGTVGVFGSIGHRATSTQGDLEQYLLNNTVKSDRKGTGDSEKGIDRWNNWHEDSTDEMRDHAMLQDFEEEEEEDVTVSVFGGKSNARKDVINNPVDKKLVDKKSAVKTPIDKKPTDKKNADKIDLDQFVLKDGEKERSLVELNLTVRTYNVLKRAGILTIEQLCSMTQSDLREIDGVGPATKAEILATLDVLGLQLSNGKSRKQLWKENKSQHVLEYWKVNLPRILRESEMVSFEKGKRPANKVYFAPNIPDEICTEAIFHMTEKHVTRFGQVLTITDDKLKAARQKDVLGVVDLSFENESACTRGVLVTVDAIYLHLGGAGREAVHPVMIPYKDFCSGWTLESGGLLKVKHAILVWTLRQTGAWSPRYDSVYSKFVDYEVLLHCLKELSEKEK